MVSKNAILFRIQSRIIASREGSDNATIGTLPAQGCGFVREARNPNEPIGAAKLPLPIACGGNSFIPHNF